MRLRSVGVVSLLAIAVAVTTVMMLRPDRGAASGRVPESGVPQPSAPAHVAAEGRVAVPPDAQVLVAAERTGRLIRIPVVEGQRVAAGELLAEIDSTELRASLAQARASVAESEAEVRVADLTLLRRQDLSRGGIVSPSDLDTAQRDLDMARARLETRRAQIAIYEAQIVKTRIMAPISGTVIARPVNTGEVIESSQAVATLADLSRLRIDAEADEADAGAVVLGASAVVNCDAFPGLSWKGEIAEISDAVTPRKLKSQDPTRPTDTRVLALKVRFLETTPLKIGASVRLSIRSPIAESRDQDRAPRREGRK
jgi:HlyD family secretion protein